MKLALLGLAILCLSTPAIVIRAARAPNEAIGFWRLLFAALLIAPSAWARRASWRALGARDRRSTGLAGVLFFAHLWTFVFAAQHTTVARCMIAFSTHPLWTGFGSWLFFGERLTKRVLLAWALAAAGVAALFAHRTSAAGSLSGDAAALVSALTFSGYVLAGKDARRKLDNTVFTAVCVSIVAALFLAAGVARSVPMTGYPWTFWACVLGLAAVVSIGGHALFTHLLNHMDVNALSCAKLLEPPLAAGWAWLAFAERPGGNTAAAFALIAAGVVVLLAPGAGASRLDAAELEE
jgi:drug/metabolite transporter (DMT)-like permease